jgi:hypothetical protein
MPPLKPLQSGEAPNSTKLTPITDIPDSASSFHSLVDQPETTKSEHPSSTHVSETLPSDHALQSVHSHVQTELDHSSPTPDYSSSIYSTHSTKASPHVSETITEQQNIP